MSLTSCDPQAVALAAKCMVCIPQGFKPTVNVSLLNIISGFNGTVHQIVDGANDFQRFPVGDSLGAEVYLLAQIAGLGGMDLSALVNLSKCFQCGQEGDLMDYTTYLYAVKAGGSTDPNDLSAGARNYQAIYGVEWRASLFLTCRWALSEAAIAACDPQALETAAHCYASCIPGYSLNALRVYLLCQIASGGGGGTPTPTGFTWVIPPASVNPQAQWDAPPAGVTATEIWTSSDNITFVLTDTVAAPGVSATETLTSSPMYAKIRFLVGATPGAFTASQSVSLSSVWANRVVANGGALPSLATRVAAETFSNSLASSGLLSKIYAMNIVAPDSLIAVLTPFICLVGNQLWTNHNFVLADLTINGLIGDGANKWMDVTFSPTDINLFPGGDVTTNFGIDFYDSASTNTSTIEVGAEANTVNLSISLLAQFAGTTFWDCPFDATLGRISFATVTGQRLIMANRSAGNAQQIYEYESGTGFNTRVTGANNVTGAPVVGVNWFVWASNRTAATLASDKRGSYVCFRQGFTLIEAQNYALIVQQLRVDIGGGFA